MLYSSTLTGAPQLSTEDVKETVGLLSVYQENNRLLEALSELRDDLLDDTAWSVTMQSFDEDKDYCNLTFITSQPQHFIFLSLLKRL